VTPEQKRLSDRYLRRLPGRLRRKRRQPQPKPKFCRSVARSRFSDRRPKITDSPSGL
jgi:hypothetical protein